MSAHSEEMEVDESPEGVVDKDPESEASDV